MPSLNKYINIPDLVHYQQQILARQLEITLSQFSRLVAFNMVGSISLVYILWDKCNQVHAIIWLSAMLIHTGVITPLFILFYRRRPARQIMGAGIQYWITGLAFIRGLLWGVSAWVLFVEESLASQAVLTSFFLGAVAIVSIVSTAYRPAFQAFIFTMVPPYIVRFSLGPTFEYKVMAFCICFFLLTMVYLNRGLNESIKQMLCLQFALEDQKEKAEAARRSQVQFLATASHDLRQPLHAHGLLLSALKSRVSDPESNRILEILSTSMSGMNRLFGSLLDISKIDAGAMIPEVRPVRVSKLLDQLFLEYEREAQGKGLRFSVKSTDVLVMSDRGLLERILANLISNAIKYTDAGTVFISGRKNGGFLRVDVRDTGKGIRPAFHQKIFQEFYRLPGQDTSKTTGMGLGLAIVKRISDLLDHPISVCSEEGKGSVFTIYLPMVETTELVDETQSMEEDAADFSKTRVLVIDDDRINLLAMRHILQRWGMDVRTASGWEEIVRLLEDEDFHTDLLIVDYNLTHHRGLDVVDRLRDCLNKEIATIVISAATTQAQLEEIMNSGFLVLHKPVMPNLLKRSIHGVMTGRLQGSVRQVKG